jgi:dTDP-4-amino-4,6-dideoxygalactose transaminase
VSSGTAAIELSLRALGVREGDEVVTTAHTFIATAEAISNLGAVPVFADIDPATFNIDPNHVEDLVTDRTRAILAVHLYGRPADLTSLMAIAERRGLWLVEDAAQAHGAEIDGRRCGSIGHLACFSFYPGKNLGAYGDAGAITGNDTAVLERIRMLRDHGRTTKYEHVEIGFAERIDALQAAILAAKLPHLEDWTEARRRLAACYARLLANVDVVVPVETDGIRHVYHLYVIRSSTRDGLLDHLKGAGIAAGIHYPIPLHRQPAYVKRGYGPVSLPHTERAAAEVLSLPMYPELSDEQQQAVVDAVGSFRG